MTFLNTLKTTTFVTTIALSLSAGAAMANMDGQQAYNNGNDNRNAAMNSNQSAQNQNAEMNKFVMFDRDKDGQLNNQEFATYTYYTIDTDNDRMISENEWDQYTEVWYEPIDLDYEETASFSDYDANNDGQIEAAEYGKAYDADLHTAWDMDNDGFIETAEYDQAVTLYNDQDSNMVYVW